MANQITPNPSVPSQVVAEVKFPKFVNNLGIIPTSYKDSMSYYETLAWLCKYLEETVIPTVNENGEAVEELQSLFIELNSYVAHYFDNLDVQEEINNKLDDMAANGELQYLLNRQYQALRTETQNSIAILRNETNQSIDEETADRLSQYNQLENQINSVASGSPAGVYATVSDLTTNNPNHSKIYVVLADGKWYYYNSGTSSWTAGGTYQSASITRDTPAIAEVYDFFNNPLLSKTKSITATLNTTTDVYTRLYTPLKAGEYVEFEVVDSSNILANDATVVITEENYATTESFLVSSERKTYQMHSDSNYIRFFINHTKVTEGGSVTFKIKRYFFGEGIIDSIKRINNILNPEFDYITFDEIKNKSGNLYNDLTYESGTVNPSTKNLLNIIITSSQVSQHSQIVKVRKENGEMYENITFNKDTGLQDPAMFCTFNENYECIRYYNNSELPIALNDESMSDVYYVILIKYPNASTTQSATYPLSSNNIYHVGVDQEYDNFTELLDELEGDDTEKTIYLHEGTYNLYTEYGGDDFFNNLPELQPIAWRTYCKIIPKNTHIIGIGNVVLYFPLPNNSNYNQVFSALNITDTCSIENIKINQTNGRYLIHIENGSSVKFSNISLNNIELNGSSFNGISIGTGINEGSVYNLNNIVDNTTNGVGYYVHTNSLKGSFININNSIFENNINLQNWANSSGNTKNSKVNINNSYIDTLRIYGTTNIDSVSAYSIKTVGTNDYTIETLYTTDYDLVQKNIIS